MQPYPLADLMKCLTYRWLQWQPNKARSILQCRSLDLMSMPPLSILGNKLDLKMRIQDLSLAVRLQNEFCRSNIQFCSTWVPQNDLNCAKPSLSPEVPKLKNSAPILHAH